MNPYIGHSSQLYGVDEYRLVGGKADGMRMFRIRNGKGLEMEVSADRCADIPHLLLHGVNLGYVSPCGYVGPAFYQPTGTDFLKSFTAGFLTTCGLTAVGSPCEDEGETLPLHGTVGNCPAERVSTVVKENEIALYAEMNQSVIFASKLTLRRRIGVSLEKNEFTIDDTVANEGDAVSPLMILYHMNMGYPLLSPSAELTIPSCNVTPRDAHAAEDLATWEKVLEPTPHFQEQCYYHEFAGESYAQIANPEAGVGVRISFDTAELPRFCQWKMMGVRDYVMGLEPGNCTPDGRDVLRKNGTLQFIQPGEERHFHVKVEALTL